MAATVTLISGVLLALALAAGLVYVIEQRLARRDAVNKMRGPLPCAAPYPNGCDRFLCMADARCQYITTTPAPPERAWRAVRVWRRNQRLSLLPESAYWRLVAWIEREIREAQREAIRGCILTTELHAAELKLARERLHADKDREILDTELAELFARESTARVLLTRLTARL